MTKIMTIEGMMCGHCTGRVQKALEETKGVSAVTMSLENKTATVELAEDVADEVLTAAVTEAGYEVKKYRLNGQRIGNPVCCHGISGSFLL